MRESTVAKGRRWRRRRRPCGLGSSKLMSVVQVSTTNRFESVRTREGGQEVEPTNLMLQSQLPVQNSSFCTLFQSIEKTSLVCSCHFRIGKSYTQLDISDYPTGGAGKSIPSTRRPTSSRSRPPTPSRAGSHAVPTTPRRTARPAYQTWFQQRGQ